MGEPLAFYDSRESAHIHLPFRRVPAIDIDRATGQVLLTMPGCDGQLWTMIAGPIDDFWKALIEETVNYDAEMRGRAPALAALHMEHARQIAASVERLDGVWALRWSAYAERAEKFRAALRRCVEGEGEPSPSFHEAVHEQFAPSNKVEDKPLPRNEVVHRGLTGCLTACVDEGLISGRVLDISTLVTFQGETVAEAVRAFRYAVDIYLGERERNGP